MKLYFDVYTGLIITNNFIFYKDNYYFYENFEIINKKLKIEPKLNQFIYSFMSKLSNGYYVIGLNGNNYTNSLCTFKKKPFNPIITSGIIKFGVDLNTSTLTYTPLPDSFYKTTFIYIKYALDNTSYDYVHFNKHIDRVYQSLRFLNLEIEELK